MRVWQVEGKHISISRGRKEPGIELCIANDKQTLTCSNITTAYKGVTAS